jgi:hypothetical protein
MKKLGCSKCGGQKMAKGGAMDKPQIYGIPQTGTTNYSAPTMKKGGKVTTRKKMGMGGMHMMPDGTMMKDSMMKKGGSVKKAKLAALAAPKNKITRADIIVGAKKRMAKKK